MSFDFSNLITNRTQADVDRAAYLASLWVAGVFTGTDEELAEWNTDLKGRYTDADLNRVTAAMEALDEMFRAYGYHTGYVPMPTWSEDDIPTQAQMDQYLDNLAALRSALASVPEEPPTPESMELLTYLTANRIEEILQQLDIYLADIGQSFLRAGMGWAAAGTALYIRNGGQQ